MRVYGGTYSDVIDRADRLLGEIHIADASELINHPRAWWVRPPCGRISYIDDFEDTLNFAQSGGTVSKASDAGYVHGGASAMKLVTGATATNYSSAGIYIAPLDESSLYATFGCWICLSAAADATPRDLILTWYASDKTLDVNYIFRLRFLQYLTTAQRKLQYWDVNAAWADVTAGAAYIRVIEPQFHYYEIAIQRVAGDAWKYHHARMDDRIFDLSGVAAFPGAFTQEEQYLAFECTTDADAATTMYVDDLAVIDSLDAAP